MADEPEEAEAKASLARLRLFLAPHAPGKEVPHVNGRQRTPADADGGSEDTEKVEANENPGEDFSGDLSTLAEQMSAAADEEERSEREGSQQVNVSEPVQVEPVECAVVSIAQDEETAKHHTVPAVGAVATVSPLSVLSREFIRVKYLLQCSLPGFRVHDEVLMWDMKNPALVEQYEARANGLLELDSWIEVDNLSAAMGELHSYGFTQVADEHNAMKFTTGAIALDPHTNKKGRKQLVLCKIAVGRSLVVSSEEEAKSKPLPPGYNSYYVSRQGENPAEAVTHGVPYRHEYILTDALQILPQYLVRFSFSALDTTTAHACALCEKSPATLVCKACDAELCAKCDEEVHSANKLVERHKRVPKRERMESTAETNGRLRRRSSTPSSAGANLVGSGDSNQIGAPSLHSEQLPDEEVSAIVTKQLEDAMGDFQATCTVHEGKKVEFFCPVCALPVCVNCKMVGDHSIGDKGAHRLLSIGDAYERSLRESFKSDPLVDARKSVIDNKLALISQWKKAVETNRDQVEATIRQQCEQALQRLNEEAQIKLSVLEGEALEFLRQQQQIEWLEDCLDEQRSSCSVIEFLSTWSQHKVLRAEQRDFPPGAHGSTGGEHVKADLQVVGSLQVVHGDHFEPRRSLTTTSALDARNDDEPSASRSESMVSIRRASDNEIRRKLLSMRSVEPTRHSATSFASPGKPLTSAMATLSSQGQKMMEEIRNDLLSRGTIRSSSSAGTTNTSRGFLSGSNPTATLRTFSIQPPRVSQTNTQIINGPARQATKSAAWTALFRQELAHAKENPVATPEQ